MRNFRICFFLLTTITTTTFSQENRFTIRSGTGYYMDVFTADDGLIYWLEGGFKFNTGFLVNLRLSMAKLDWEINKGVFENYITVQLREMADINVSRPISLKKNHYLEPGMGFKLKKEYFLKPDVTYVYSSSGDILYTRYSDIFYEIGFNIYLDYYYQFKSNFYMGLRVDSNVIWALGFEGLTVSPLFGFRF